MGPYKGERGASAPCCRNSRKSSRNPILQNLTGQRVTVMGLGRFGGGAGAARWLAGQGAVVTVTDLADEVALADSLTSLADSHVAAFHLGGHREEDFRTAQMVVVNPAVHPDNRLVKLAVQCGARIVTEIELFIERCPGRLVGVTGSNGKSTTAAMTAAMLQADGRRSWLGGNLGGSLLDRLDQMRPEGLGRARIEQLSTVVFRAASPRARGRRGHQLHAQPSQLASQLRPLCGRQATTADQPATGRCGRAQRP